MTRSTTNSTAHSDCWGQWQRIRFVLVPICVLLAVLVAQAQAPEALHLDLQACVDASTQNNPRLNARDARLSVRESMVNATRAERLPRMDFRGEVGYLEGYSITPFALLRGIDPDGIRNKRVEGGYYQAVAVLSVPLFGGGLNSQVSRTQNLVSESTWEIEAERVAVAWTVAEAYTGALQLNNALRTYEQIASLFEADISVARARFEQDLISENDVLTAEVRLATAQRDLLAARLGLRQSYDALSAAMGQPVGAVFSLEEFPETAEPDVSREELATLLSRNHPILKAQEYNVKAQQSHAKALRANRYGDVGLDVRYGAGNDFDDFDDHADWMLQAAVVAKIPVFNLGLDKKKAAVVKAREAESSRLLEDMRLAVGQELAAIYGELDQSEVDLELADAMVAQAAAAVKLQEAMVKESLASEAELHEAQMNLLTLRLEREDVEYNRELSLYKLNLLWKAASGH